MLIELTHLAPFFLLDIAIFPREPQPILPEDEGLEKLPQYPETLKLMGDFIREYGGSARFDAYMSEHLFGKGGFYSDRARIREKGDSDFTTDATKPEFAEFVSHCLIADPSVGKDFLEIGGGSGVFKKSYLNLHPDARYLSADMSPRLAALQRNAEGSDENKGTMMASGFNLPLADRSIDGTIFNNELLDALPCRTFRVKEENGKVSIAEEAYVVADGDNLNFEYKPVERDEFVNEYEEFLSEIQPTRKMKDGEVISASSAFKPLFQELTRVLDKGKIVMIDYGFDDESQTDYQYRFPQEKPYVGRDVENGIDRILERPYETDVTFEIDFPFCRWLLSKIPDLEVKSEPLAELAKDQLTEGSDFSKEAQNALGYMKERRGFSVLEVSRRD